MSEENNRKSQLNGLVAVSLFDFSLAGKRYLKNKVHSFVEQKILFVSFIMDPLLGADRK